MKCVTFITLDYILKYDMMLKSFFFLETEYKSISWYFVHTWVQNDIQVF